jgi:ElaB/YqjD/DUF883 family membrane-anchored ribosome-binding protein
MNDHTRNELQESRDRLARHARSVVDDAEQLLRAGVQGTGEAYAEARGRLEQSLGSAKSAILRVERAAVDRASAAGGAANSYVHENPWQAIAVGAAVGALIAVLLARR